jgi:hypothetical protein
MVIVDLLMYCFQASLPDSRPPPVCFSPPKAPPISAPEVGMFTLTIPQSDPFGPIHRKYQTGKEDLITLNMFSTLWVKILEETPCGTSLFHETVSSTLSAFRT